MSIQLDLELLPLEVLNSRDWVLRERETGFFIELSETAYKTLIEEYTEIEWENIREESQKVEFKFNYLPQEIKEGVSWDLIQVRGEWVVYITQKLYKKIIKKYHWIRLDNIPVEQPFNATISSRQCCVDGL